MARFFTAALTAAASVGVVLSAHGEPYMYTVTGACDAQDSIDGLTFLKRGYTANGAPWYKAIDAEKYLYFDADCMGSTDGTPRWIIDNDTPSLTRINDLDDDHFCDYIGRINSHDLTRPPAQGLWTLNCGGTWQQNYLILLEGTTTSFSSTLRGNRAGAQGTPAPSTSAAPVVGESNGGAPVVRHQSTTLEQAHTTAVSTVAQALILDGACKDKGFLNGLIFEEAGTTADGRPFFKAAGRDEYLYYDKDCDGPGDGNTLARWVIDSDRPSTTALKDLDQDGKCDYHARWNGDILRPPSAATWRMYCGASAGRWTDVDIRLRDYKASTTTRHKAAVSSSRRSAGPAAALALLAAAWLALTLGA